MVRKSLRHTWLSQTPAPSKETKGRASSNLAPEARFRRGTTPGDRHRNACNLGQPEPAT
jgi:hypothetical protein